MKIQEKAILHNRFDVKVVDAESGKVKQTAVGYNVILNYYFSSIFIDSNRVYPDY